MKIEKNIIIIVFISLFNFVHANNPDSTKIEVIKFEDGDLIKFRNASINTNKYQMLEFSPDSLYCAISNDLRYGESQGYFIYNINGEKINHELINGRDIKIFNDGRFVIYEPIYSESLFISKSTLKFYNNNAKEIMNNYFFNEVILLKVLENNFLLIVHQKSISPSDIINHRIELVLLNEDFNIISKNGKLLLDLKLIGNIILDNEKNGIIIQDKLKENSIYKHLDLNLNEISN